MQRKALKQLGKVTQWTSEKVFSGEKTQLSDEFTEFEREIEPRRIGIERLHATSLPFFHQLTKVKPTADPYPPSGSGKDKILHTEALGLVMIDYGGDIGGGYGDGLAKYGRARCKLAATQEDFGSRLSENYIAGMESALAAVNDYKALRKKLDSRRLTLDAAITRAQSSKKDSRMLEVEVEQAQARFEEVEEETTIRMQALQEGEEEQFAALTDLLEAELDYFGKCLHILEELRESWPSGPAAGSRPRAKSNASARSMGRTATTRTYTRPTASASDEDDGAVTNRNRSQSNASSGGRGKDRRSMLPSFGSFGKKSLASAASAGKKKTFGSSKERYDDDRQALNSEDDEEDSYARPPHSPAGRMRSQSSLSASRLSLADTASAIPPMRRTYTSPSSANAHYVKVLYDFSGGAADELELRAGQIVEVKKEVSDDWWIGECDGRSGLFPKVYTEEYVPTPTTAVPPPPMPARQRSMPPPPSGGGATPRSLPPPQAPSSSGAALAPPRPSFDYPTSESEAESLGYSDGDHRQTAPLSAYATSSSRPPTASSGMAGKKPPPPPPSRRSQSSSNLMSSPSLGAPPPPPANRARASTLSRQTQARFDTSPEGSPFGGGSPFAGSEDESGRSEGGDGDYLTASAARGNGSGGGGGGGHGLGALHLGAGATAQGAAANVAPCGQCGCADFTQNVFKAKGMCSTCYHQH